jgi:hypothetical protein
MIASTIDTLVTAALDACKGDITGYHIETDADGVTVFVRVPVAYINGVAGDFDAPTRLRIARIELALRGFRFIEGRIDGEGFEMMEYGFAVDVAQQVANLEARIGALERAGVIVGGRVRDTNDDGTARSPSQLSISLTVAATYWNGDSADGYDDATETKRAAIDAALPDLRFYSDDAEDGNEVWHYRVV